MFLGMGNWLQYGWGQSMKDDYARGDHMHITIKKSANNFSALAAATHAVENIVQNYPSPYTLMCSGGVDSQAMLWAWKQSGHPFEVVSIKYVSGGKWFNEYDLCDLVKFSEVHNISVNYLSFDVINFLEGELPAMASITECDSPQICTYMKMTELVESGTILFSGNFSDSSVVPLSHTLLGMHRYSLLDHPGRKIIPFFFLHTAELAFGFVIEQDTSKNQAYTNNGFPVVYPTKKYNGFEQLKEHYDQFSHRVSRRTRFIYGSRPSSRAFDLLFRYPNEPLCKKHDFRAPLHQHVI